MDSNSKGKKKVIKQILTFYFHSNKSEQKYENQGKTGGAILGVLSTNTFHLLMYKKANEHLCKVPITPSFKFTVCFYFIIIFIIFI